MCINLLLRTGDPRETFRATGIFVRKSDRNRSSRSCSVRNAGKMQTLTGCVKYLYHWQACNFVHEVVEGPHLGTGTQARAAKLHQLTNEAIYSRAWQRKKTGARKQTLTFVASMCFSRDFSAVTTSALRSSLI